LSSNFDPQNTLCIPAVKILARLDFLTKLKRFETGSRSGSFKDKQAIC